MTFSEIRWHEGQVSQLFLNVPKQKFESNSKLGIAWPLRLRLFIIYVWVVHLRDIADKKLPSLQFLSPSISTNHLAFSQLPFSCHFSVKLAQILPTEENFLLCFRQFVSSSAEFMAVRVQFLCVGVCMWMAVYIFLMQNCCVLMNSVIWSVLCNSYS